jgi:uncharacterized protein DUF2721
MADLIPVLQVAVGPVILISGVGLLLLSMTNRFGRIVDRSRMIARELRQSDADERARALSQVDILWRRARLVRRAIALATTSVLIAAILVIALFGAAVAHIEVASLVVVLFGSCLLTLVGSLLAFMQEVNESLRALKLDLFGP